MRTPGEPPIECETQKQRPNRAQNPCNDDNSSVGAFLAQLIELIPTETFVPTKALGIVLGQIGGNHAGEIVVRNRKPLQSLESGQLVWNGSGQLVVAYIENV